MSGSNGACATGRCAIAGLALFALLSAPVVSAHSTTFCAEFERAIAEVGGDAALAMHAGYGNIFVGEVTARAAQDDAWPGPDGEQDHLIWYDVAVGTTLRGEAAGEVMVRYSGADVMSAETRGMGPLLAGRRYLFSAGTRSPDGAYPVFAGSGVILLESAEIEAAFLAVFARLLPRAQVQYGEMTSPSMSTPTLGLRPHCGQAGSQVVIHGESFQPGLAEIFWDGARLPDGAEVRGAVTLRAIVLVPADAAPGEHIIVVKDAQGSGAGAVFFVIS